MEHSSRNGAFYAATSYVLWGVFPLYFHHLKNSNAVEIVGHRIVWSLIFCLALLTATKSTRQLADILRNRRSLGLFTAAAFAVGINWMIYIYAVTSNQVVEASLGYFINPLVTVLLGVVVFGERLRQLQWVAVGIAACAVAVLTASYGHPPKIAIALALSFGLYGVLKKKAGLNAGALAGLTTETLVLTPFAIGVIVWFGAQGKSSFLRDAPETALLMVGLGLITVLPLLAFAAAARRVPLSTMGILQYMSPSISLFIGLVFFDEAMPLERWLGFGLVWLGLLVHSIDGWQRRRRTVAGVTAATA